ncbi:MAG: glutathione peroxidase [Bacteriovoracaceae bacterium]|nr:glutathione peroxidase [Bacteriovoracaceae bacterium]
MTKIQTISFTKTNGEQGSLKEFEGKVLLVVNVASKCGLTPQYEGLEKIQREYSKKGFTVLGFPANNFKGQEPGTNEEIQQFCKLKYDVTFPVFQKISVKGADTHPLYKALMEAQPKAQTEKGSGFAMKLALIGERPDSESGILWNFEKFLIDKKGNVVARFAPDMTPDSETVRKEIEKNL